MSEIRAAVRSASLRAGGMPRSAIREIMALAAGKPDVIHLEVGDPDLSTPAHVIDAMHAAARDGWTHYAANAGLPSLRAAIAARVSKRTGRTVSPDRIVVTVGAIGALFAALMSVVDAGDEVLIPDPGWPNYEAICHLAGANAVRYALPAAQGFVPDPDAIRRQVNARTKALLLNSPGNPSGAVFAPDLIRAFARLAVDTGIYLVCDEIYEDMIFEGRHESIGAYDVDDRALVISGFSKSYAMTGWRLGWIVCPAQIAPLAAGLQEPVISCAPTMIQKAGEAALAGDQACVTELCDTYRRRRDVVIEVLGQTEYLPVVPNGAFYALVDVAKSGMRSLDFAKALLTRENVAVVPGVTFGPQCDRYVRVAFTVPDDKLRDGLTRLRRFLDGQSQR